MNPVIRKAKIEEAHLLSDIALKSKAFWGYSAEFMAACKEELTVTQEKIKSKAFSYWVYEHENSILGFYAIEKISSEVAELEAIFVSPESIGKGIGKALMDHAISFARSSEAASLRIQSDPNAKEFYLTAGASIVGEEESSNIEGRYLPVLSIEL